MFKTTVGALGGEDDASFLRPETAQGIFVNFKNVVDSTRVRVPFGVAQVGKSFRNEITPRNFTFRSREFEQMEIEFFCHPSESAQWYAYWRDRRFQWYVDMGLAGERLRMREHEQAELAHYSIGTADIEYAFPFLPEGEFGELEGVAHRGDFDLRSHAEGKLIREGDALVLEKDASGAPKWRGSGKDMSYFDDQRKERFVPHVVEPSAARPRDPRVPVRSVSSRHGPDVRSRQRRRTSLLEAAPAPRARESGGLSAREKRRYARSRRRDLRRT